MKRTSGQTAACSMKQEDNMKPDTQTTTMKGDGNVNTHRQAATMVASSRKLAVAAGVLFLISDVLAVGAAILYGPVQNNASYITGSGSDTQVLLGAFFEVIVALAVVGTAVALFPAVKRQNEGVALGYVGLRTLEAGIIAVGVVPLLVVVTLRQHLAATAGADTAALVTLGSAFVAFFNWSFLIGQGLVVGVNTVLIAYLVHPGVIRSGVRPPEPCPCRST
jgi:Domain of unknown function (DUF4386)